MDGRAADAGCAARGTVGASRTALRLSGTVRAFLRPYPLGLLVSRVLLLTGVQAWPGGAGGVPRATSLQWCMSGAVSAGDSAPAELSALGGVNGVEAVDRLVGDERDSRVVEVKTLRVLGLGTAVRDRLDRLDPELGHLQRVLLRGGTDDALLDLVDPVATAVDRADQHALGIAALLESAVRADCGGLVDGVDDVDVLVLGQAVLHRRATTVLVARGGLVADDLVVAAVVGPGLGLVAVLLLVLGVDAHAGEETLVPVVVHGDDLVVEQVEHRDGGLLALQLGLGPLTDQLTGLEVVGGERDVHGVRRVGRGVQGDHVEALVAGLLARGVAPRAWGRDQDAVAPPGDAFLITP